MSNTQNDTHNGKTRAVETLDVEGEAEREQRMRDIFQQLDSKAGAKSQPGPRSLQLDFGDRSTFMVEPPSELLSRVQAFLPQFAASTDEIARRAQEDPDSVDIEKLMGEEDKYIQMNLGLGVFEEQGGAQSSSSTGDSDTEMHASETSATSSDSDSTSHSDSSDSSDGYDSDSSVDIISSTMASLAQYRPIKPLPRRRSTRPQIVELQDASAMQDSGSSSSSGDSQA
ncbi:hypothetical protein PsYK624_056550 [Phanerochaete sordida]|uniref:Uncharacterized protein n=1 Tax=Phanerochaete sordida TaxID=48140 RepID=A0A9P3G7L9_9APHY|nr:hypothetical protein PsYK624_056550 [Phanerochaete sordida]